MTTDPVLPYGGADDPNSGFSGSETSEARARHADTTGVTGRRQRAALLALAAVGERGLTWREAASILGTHHGPASGVLSNLHKVGRIDRLHASVRDGSKVYVLPEYVNGRAVDRPKSNRRDPYFEAVLPVLARLACPLHEEPHDQCPMCRDVALVFSVIRNYQREVQAHA